ncbi:dirigent protein 22-like [Primulina huaijiensis]|uniref:dirigent protein 22-like n=1 Tax=Primulina huaijiensis TaxID=1492673 RepID=UPI003CC72978
MNPPTLQLEILSFFSKKMAKIVILLMFYSWFVVASANGSNNNNEEPWLQNVCRGNGRVHKLHFYVQDVLDGPNATVWEVARSTITNGSPTYFGQVAVIDELITSGPEPTSNVLGRAQGLITMADMHEFAWSMNWNFVFTAGEYKGSTLSILGRKSNSGKYHELPVVGGTGIFRMARGYCISDTYSFDLSSKYGVYQYTVYVTLVDQLNLSVEMLANQ